LLDLFAAALGRGQGGDEIFGHCGKTIIPALLGLAFDLLVFALWIGADIDQPAPASSFVAGIGQGEYTGRGDGLVAGPSKGETARMLVAGKADIEDER